jgi:hypothetical protein
MLSAWGRPGQLDPRRALGFLWLALGAAATAAGQMPGAVTPGPPQVAIPALVHGLIEDSARLSEVLRRELGDAPQARQIRQKVDPLRGAAEQLDRALKLREPMPRREAMRQLRQTYQPVADVLARTGPSAPGSQRIGERIGQKIGVLEDAMGIPRPPAVPVEVRLQRALIREYTAMIAEVDTFMAGLNDRVPEGPQIRAEALALRDAVRQLRRHTAQGAPDRRIVQELAAAVEARRVLANRVERLNRGRAPGPNVLRLRRIGEILARIQGAANAA